VKGLELDVSDAAAINALTVIDNAGLPHLAVWTFSSQCRLSPRRRISAEESYEDSWGPSHQC